MVRSINLGTASIAAGLYGLNKLKPAVAAASEIELLMARIKGDMWDSTMGADKMAEAMKDVRDNARGIGAEFGFTSAKVLQATDDFVKAGLTLEEIKGKGGAVWTALAMAGANQEDLGAISQYLALAGVAFGLRGNQYKETGDWATRVAGATSLSVGGIAYGFQRSGAEAALMNITPKDLTTLIGVGQTLREEVGTDVKDFLERMNPTHRQQRKMMEENGLSFYEHGEFVGVREAIKRLKTRTGGMNEQEMGKFLTVIFGQQGGQYAKALLLAEQKGQGFDYIEKKALESASLDQRIKLIQGTHSMSRQGLLSKLTDTGAMIGEPLLPILTEIYHVLTDLLSATQHIPGLLGGLGLGLAGLGTAALAYGGYNMIRGAGAGWSVWRGLRGMGGVGLGVAEGKALEAAAGVTPVFITNWPMGGLGGLGGPAILGGGKRGGWRGMLGMAAMVPVVGYGLDQIAESFTGATSQDRNNAANMGVGVLGGAAVGAAMGSIVPILGTGIGALLGALLGGGAAALGNSANEKKAEVSIRFENAPAGMRVNSLSGRGVETTVETGMMMRPGYI